MQLRVFIIFVAIFSENKFYYLVNAGGTLYLPCSKHTQEAKYYTDNFIILFTDIQKKCISSLSSFASTNANLAKTEFTNRLYEIYNDCVNEEGDAFKQYYDGLLKLLTGLEEISISENVMSYLTGVVDVTQFPFVCINELLQTAVETISLYDSQLSTASQYHLKHRA